MVAMYANSCDLYFQCVVAMCDYHVSLPRVVAKGVCHELYTYLCTFFLAFSRFLLFSSLILPRLPLLSYNYIFPNSHSTLLFSQNQPWEKVLFLLFLSYYFYHLNFFFLHLAIHSLCSLTTCNGSFAVLALSLKN